MQYDKTGKANPYLNVLGYSASIVTLATLLAYGYTTIYYYGYFRAFDIDMHAIAFFPKIIDIIFWGIIACIFLVISTVLCFFIIYIITVAAKKIGSTLANKYEWLRWLLKPKINNTPQYYKVILCVTIVLAIAFGLVVYTADNQGYRSGKEQSQFTAIMTNNDEIKILIYQNENIGIFKNYDKSSKTFDKSYDIELTYNKKFYNISL